MRACKWQDQPAQPPTARVYPTQSSGSQAPTPELTRQLAGTPALSTLRSAGRRQIAWCQRGRSGVSTFSFLCTGLRWTFRAKHTEKQPFSHPQQHSTAAGRARPSEKRGGGSTQEPGGPQPSAISGCFQATPRKSTKGENIFLSQGIRNPHLFSDRSSNGNPMTADSMTTSYSITRFPAASKCKHFLRQKLKSLQSEPKPRVRRVSAPQYLHLREPQTGMSYHCSPGRGPQWGLMPHECRSV